MLAESKLYFVNKSPVLMVIYVTLLILQSLRIYEALASYLTSDTMLSNIENNVMCKDHLYINLT